MIILLYIFVYDKSKIYIIIMITNQMQKGEDCANYIFNRIGLKYDTNLLYQPQLIFSQILMGQLFIKGYRMLNKNPQHQCVILYKRDNFQTYYLYLKFIETQYEKLRSNHLSDIGSSIKMIDKMKSCQQKDYKVMIGHLKERSYIQLNKQQFLCSCNKQKYEFQVIFLNKQITIDEDVEKMMVTSKDELIQLKDLVWTYINTFASKYKNNYYSDLSKRNPTSFNIQKLINTVNWIIYCQTVDKPFNQIQTANWTCFQKRAKEKLKPDRKDILLTGSGRSMMIHLLLLQKIENYKKQYETEVGQVIFEFRKSYVEGQVKAYQISDKLDSYNLIYKLRSDTIQKFNTI